MDTRENEEDRKQCDAMMPSGYYRAFQSVKESIKIILQGKMLVHRSMLII
jgi:hypothetical protein